MGARNRSSEKIYVKYRKDNKEVILDKCVFCLYSKGDSEYVIEKTKNFIVANNRFGYDIWDDLDVLDHLMIIPKEHTESIATLPSSNLTEFAQLLAKYEGQGYSFYARSSGHVTKSIPHQHTHLIKLGTKRKKFILYMNSPYLLLHK